MHNKIYELTKLIDEDFAQNIYSDKNRVELACEINSLISENSIVLAQVNPSSGNVKYNALKAKKWIELAEHIGAQAIVFPELYLVGAPIGDYILKFPIIVKECLEWLEILAKFTKNTKVLIGFVESDNNKNMEIYYNSVAVLFDGKIEKIIRKEVLNNIAENNENRYFSSFPSNYENRIISINKKNALILIGDEDIYLDKILKNNTKPDLIINCCAKISRCGKEYYISDKFSKLAKNYSVPYIMVNQVGSSDCLSYDGASRVYYKNGNLTYRANSFNEQFFIADPFNCNGKIYPLPKGSEMPFPQKFSINYEYDLDRTYQSIVQSIRDYFRKNGFERACLGLSGGLDSTICAVLLADALGKENIVGVSMPSQITSSESKNDAKTLAYNLGINYIEMPIKEMFNTTREIFDGIFYKIKNWQNVRYKQSYTNDNIQARTRATILWGISNEFEKCLPIATSDKSEAYMGYATINGDMSGGYAPIADVTKTKLFALADWLNKNRLQKNVIPQSIINKRPGAELAINPNTGKPLLAEEALMPYEFLDEVIWRVENLHQSINDMLNDDFLYEKQNKISIEQKQEWLQKFFRRMTTSIYKSFIMPPFPIIDRYSINKFEYKQAITTTGINFQKTNPEEKLQIFNTLSEV